MSATVTIKALKEATADPSSLSELDRAQLVGACTEFIDAAAPVERKLMDLMFAVSLQILSKT